MSETTALESLASLPLLQDLSPESRARVAKVFYEVSADNVYQDEEVIIHEGYLSFDSGYVLYDGNVQVEPLEGDSIAISAPTMLGEMSQFSVGDTRNATVRAKGEVHALLFWWEDLYEAAAEELPDEDNDAFRKAVETLVWDRFPHKQITELAMFKDLGQALRERVCSPLPSITEVVRLNTGETLFREDTLCKSTGYLVLKGKLSLVSSKKPERPVEAPDIIGMFPAKTDDQPKWSGAAVSMGDSELLKFSWEEYTSILKRRLSKDELGQLVNSMKNNRAAHIWH